MFNRIGSVGRARLIWICAFVFFGVMAQASQGREMPTKQDFLVAICSDHNVQSSKCHSVDFDTGYDSSCEVEVGNIDRIVNEGIVYFLVSIDSPDENCWSPHTGFLNGTAIVKWKKNNELEYVTYFAGETLDINCVKSSLRKSEEEVLFCMNFFADQGGTHIQYLQRFGSVGPRDGKRLYALEQSITATALFPGDHSYDVECDQKPIQLFFEFDNLRYDKRTHSLEMDVVYADPKQIAETCSDPNRHHFDIEGKITTSANFDSRQAHRGILEYDYLRGNIHIKDYR